MPSQDLSNEIGDDQFDPAEQQPVTPPAPADPSTIVDPRAAVLDTRHSDRVEIRVYDRANGRRRALPYDQIADARWTIEPRGGYADFSLSISADPSDLTSIVAGDMVEVWDWGIRQYRGYVGDLARSEAEPPTLTISGYGRVLDLERMMLVGAYQRASDVDLSDLFSEIAADIQTRYPDISVVADVIGVTTSAIDAAGKTAREVLDALVSFAQSVAVWGFDTDDYGRDRLYLRRIDTSVVDASIAIPGARVGRRETALRVADVVNVVTVEGGQPDYPQLLPNGSFETLVKSGEGVGANLIANPSFEAGGASWSLTGGASLKSNGGQEPPARTGNQAVELDNFGETVSQTVDTPVTPLSDTKRYEIGAWVRPEWSADQGSNAPKARIRVQWRSLGSDLGSPVDWEIAAGIGAWQFSAQTLQPPTDATGFRISISHWGGSTGGNKGLLVDDVSVVDVSAMVADRWSMRTYGAARVYAANWGDHRPLFTVGVLTTPERPHHGRNCLFASVLAADTDGQDVHLRCTPSYYFDVVGGQQVRFGGRFASVLGAAVPKMLMEVAWYKSDGSPAGTITRTPFAEAVLSGWTYRDTTATAPNDATKCEVWVTVRGTGQFYVDALSARIVPTAGNESTSDTTYLPEGPLSVVVRADEAFTAAENAAAYNSISTYGVRERREQAADLTTTTDARAWGKAYLAANAVAVLSPTVDLYDDQRQWRIGSVVRLVGQVGSAYADRALAVQRVNGSIASSGLLTHSLQLGKVQPTDEELIARLARRSATNIVSSSGAGGSRITGGSPTFVGGTSAGVSSLNALSGDLSIAGAGGLSVSASGSTVTVSGATIQAAVTALQSRTITGTGGLTGGGDLTANRTISIATGGVTSTLLADGAVTLPKISATGTRSSSTYLRGDGAWATIAGGGTGTVTQVDTGQGLTGGPITSSGTVSIANLGVTGGMIANSTITVGKLSATGTAGTTTFLRGDGSWQTPSVFGAATFSGMVSLPAASGSTASLQFATSLGGTTAFNALYVTQGTPSALIFRNSDGTAVNLSGTIATSRLAATGTASSSTFLRGDGQWAVPPSATPETWEVVWQPGYSQHLRYVVPPAAGGGSATWTLVILDAYGVQSAGTTQPMAVRKVAGDILIAQVTLTSSNVYVSTTSGTTATTGDVLYLDLGPGFPRGDGVTLTNQTVRIRFRTP